MIKLKDILLEKKELHKNQIQAIGVLTQRNNHDHEFHFFWGCGWYMIRNTLIYYF